MSQPVEFPNLKADMPIIGFTGALGSGCTYLAEGLEEHYNYLYVSLSTYIHEGARSNDIEENSDKLQDIGNYLRHKYGVDVLTRWALEDIDAAQPWRIEKTGRRVSLSTA